MDSQVRWRHEDYKTMVPNVRRKFHGTFSSAQCRFYVGVRNVTQYVLRSPLDLHFQCWCFCYCGAAAAATADTVETEPSSRFGVPRPYCCCCRCCCCCCCCLLQGPMCLRPDCGLCSIATHGFKMEDNVGRSPARGNKIRWLMFGRGIYFTGSSGKANYFSQLTAKVRQAVRYRHVLRRLLVVASSSRLTPPILAVKLTLPARFLNIGDYRSMSLRNSIPNRSDVSLVGPSLTHPSLWSARAS